MNELPNRHWQAAQKRAHWALDFILEHAFQEAMPVLTWTIPPTGELIGQVDSLAGTADEQRAAFDAWVSYLGGKPAEARERAAGGAYLQATFEWKHDSRVHGVIHAAIWPDEGGDR